MSTPIEPGEPAHGPAPLSRRERRERAEEATIEGAPGTRPTPEAQSTPEASDVGEDADDTVLVDRRGHDAHSPADDAGDDIENEDNDATVLVDRRGLDALFAAEDADAGNDAVNEDDDATVVVSRAVEVTDARVAEQRERRILEHIGNPDDREQSAPASIPEGDAEDATVVVSRGGTPFLPEDDATVVVNRGSALAAVATPAVESNVGPVSEPAVEPDPMPSAEADLTPSAEPSAEHPAVPVSEPTSDARPGSVSRPGNIIPPVSVSSPATRSGSADPAGAALLPEGNPFRADAGGVTAAPERRIIQRQYGAEPPAGLPLETADRGGLVPTAERDRRFRLGAIAGFAASIVVAITGLSVLAYLAFA
ncbi:hypothetical protein [Mycetocola saprophilus]|uniref:hypothetical protein n=1 Tax=Mycetocola saprophilus TaxID=76636 RepID=UPI003BF41546